jgi:transcription elongation factor Elf1
MKNYTCPHCNHEFFTSSDIEDIDGCPMCGYSPELNGDGEEFNYPPEEDNDI